MKKKLTRFFGILMFMIAFCMLSSSKDAKAATHPPHTWSNNWEPYKNATCGKDREEKRQCTYYHPGGNRCPSIETRPVPGTATGNHSWGSWTTTEEPTCEDSGKKERTCSVCKKKETQTIPAKGHSMGSWYTVTAATCTENGKDERKCIYNDKTETRTVKAKGHKFGDLKVEVEATCMEYGSGYKKCKNGCGTKENVTIPMKSHDGIPFEEHVTCTTDGRKGTKCKNCGTELGNVIITPATGHDFSGSTTVIKAATCTEYGSGYKTCKNGCGETQPVTIDKKPHDCTYFEEPATCTQNGRKGSKCKNCGNVIGDTISIPTKNHDFSGATHVETDSTCTKTGSGYIECKNGCGSRQNVEIPMKNHEGIAFENPATCTADGEKGTKCKHCGTVLGNTTVIPAKNHDFSGATHVETDSTCTKTGSGYIECKNGCGSKRNVEIPMKNHEGIAFEEAPTCTTDGQRGSKCRNCGTILGNTEIIPATGHNYGGDVVKVKYENCTEAGSGYIRCQNSGCGSTKPVTIPATEHYGTPFTEDSTCYKEGRMGTKCAHCGKVLGDVTIIPKKAHVYGKKEYNASESTDTLAVYYQSCTNTGCTASIRTTEAIGKGTSEQYSITYDANGGTDAPASQSATIGEKIKITKTKPKWTGYKFKGWSFKSGENQTVDFEPGDVYTGNADVTLYAVWKKKNATSSVSPYENGKEFKFNKKGTCTNVKGGKVILELESEDEWTVTSSKKWVDIGGAGKKLEGTGSQSVQINVSSSNSAEKERKASVTVKFKTGETYKYIIVQKLDHIHQYEYKAAAKTGVTKVRCSEKSCDEHKWKAISLQEYKLNYMNYNSKTGEMNPANAETDDIKAIKEYFGYAIGTTDAAIIAEFYASYDSGELTDTYNKSKIITDTAESLSGMISKVNVISGEGWKKLSNFRKWQKVLIEDDAVTKSVGKALDFKNAYDKCSDIEACLTATTTQEKAKAWLDIEADIVGHIPVVGSTYKTLFKDISAGMNTVITESDKYTQRIFLTDLITDVTKHTIKMPQENKFKKEETKNIFELSLSELNDEEVLNRLLKQLGKDNFEIYIEKRVEFELRKLSGECSNDAKFLNYLENQA